MTAEKDKYPNPQRLKELPSPRHLLTQQPFLAKAFEYGIAGNPEVHVVEKIDEGGNPVSERFVEFHDTQIDHILSRNQLPLKKPYIVSEGEIREVRNWLDRFQTAFPYIYEDVNLRGSNRNSFNVLPDYESMNAKCAQVEELLAIDLSEEQR